MQWYIWSNRGVCHAASRRGFVLHNIPFILSYSFTFFIILRKTFIYYYMSLYSPVETTSLLLLYVFNNTRKYVLSPSLKRNSMGWCDLNDSRRQSGPLKRSQLTYHTSPSHRQISKDEPSPLLARESVRVFTCATKFIHYPALTAASAKKDACGRWPGEGSRLCESLDICVWT